MAKLELACEPRRRKAEMTGQSRWPVPLISAPIQFAGNPVAETVAPHPGKSPTTPEPVGAGRQRGGLRLRLSIGVWLACRKPSPGVGMNAAPTPGPPPRSRERAPASPASPGPEAAQAAARSRDVRLHPEMPPVSLPRPVHLRVAGLQNG